VTAPQPHGSFGEVVAAILGQVRVGELFERGRLDLVRRYLWLGQRQLVPVREHAHGRSQYVLPAAKLRRRTKPMEIVAGENACYLLLAFISLKMEANWRSTKIGKVRPNLPLYKKFTQLG